ncbi:tyrosine-protein phosphatase [Cohnella sp. GCM10027633]|uniref:tyrosine-protein phosphatase n=1 Tax=unclassified Cohnella TaxID=2636738 RepID=UPI00363AEC82
MIDTHCHILPMCDDGPDHWKQSLEMAKEAVRQGITEIVATPHHLKGSYLNQADKIVQLVDQLNDRLVEEEIALTVYAGQELHVSDKAMKASDADAYRTLGWGRYILIELPSRDTPKRLFETVRKLQACGLTPIIAHPERHLPFIKMPERLDEWINKGVLFQLTAPSVVGHFGVEVKEAALAMARQRRVHLLGSDAHDTYARGFRLEEAFRVLEAETSVGETKKLQENAYKVVHGQFVEYEGLPPPRKSKPWWSFSPRAFK